MKRRIYRRIALQIGVILSLVGMIAKLLDWFNPYMDFTGHVWYLQLALYLIVIWLAFSGGRERNRIRQKMTSEKTICRKIVYRTTFTEHRSR